MIVILQNSAFWSHLILDGAGYHPCDDVKKKAVLLNIKLQYLPPYSSNLNPIERLWKVMNEDARNNRYFAAAKEFRRQINHFFECTLPTIGNTLNGRINDNFQILKSVPWGRLGIGEWVLNLYVSWVNMFVRDNAPILLIVNRIRLKWTP